MGDGQLRSCDKAWEKRRGIREGHGFVPAVKGSSRCGLGSGSEVKVFLRMGRKLPQALKRKITSPDRLVTFPKTFWGRG